MDDQVGELVLTRGELQRASEIGQSKPDFDALRVVRGGKDLAVPRDFVISQIIGSVPGFQDRRREYFDIKEGWEALGITLGGQTGEEVSSAQPSSEQIDAWEKMAREMSARQGISPDEARRRVRELMLQGEGTLAEKEASQPGGRLTQTFRKVYAPETEKSEGPGEVSRFRSKETGAFLERYEKYRGTYRSPVAKAWDQLWITIHGGAPLVAPEVSEVAEMAARQETAQRLGLFKSLQKRFGMGEFAGKKAAVGGVRVTGAAGGAAGTTAGATGAAKVAAGAGIKAVTEKAEQAAVATGARALGAKVVGAVSGPVGWAVTILSSKGLRKLLKTLAEGVAGAATLLLIKLVTSLSAIGGAALVGGFIGGIVGFFVGGPLGAVVGFGVGAVVGGWTGSILLGGGGIGPVATAAATVPVIGGGIGVGTTAVGATAGALVGSGLPVVIGVGGGMAAAMFTVIAVGGAMATQPVISHDKQGVPPIFTVSKMAAPSQVDNLKAGETKTVTYSITINSAGSSQVTLSDFSDKVTAYTPGGLKTDLKVAWKDNPNGKSTPFSTTGQMVISGNGYNDSNIINTVSVKGKDASGKEQAQSATAVVTVGHPVDGPPYGFPKAGLVEVLDDESVTVDGEKHQHCGEIDPPSSSCPLGGIDIGGGGEVVSTVDGYVDLSSFDCRLGGVVRIRSKTGAYTVALIHLDDKDRMGTGPVSRGQRIGSVYDRYSEICGTNSKPGLGASTGAHVHYQIFAGGTGSGNNLKFSEPANAGKCSKGKIEPEVISHDGVLIQDTPPNQWVAPACQ